MNLTIRMAAAALAATGASAAMAQTSITLYGRINTTVEYQKAGGVGTSGVYDNASRWGVRGTEDLGGGLKAGFVLESGFNSDTGTGGGPGAAAGGGLSFNRWSEVNLSSDRLGMLRMGAWVPDSYHVSADGLSLHNHDTGSSADKLYRDPIMYGELFIRNKVGYTSPSIGGWVVNAAMSMHERANAYNQNGYDLSTYYRGGPLFAGAGFSRVGDDWQASLSTMYTFGQVTVGGYYQRNHQESARLGWMTGNRNNFRLVGRYTLGASEFHANVGHVTKWSDVKDSAATQWTLGYNYNLSKRTKVYAYYTRVNNGGGASYNVSKPGDNFSSVAMGIRHNF